MDKNLESLPINNALHENAVADSLLELMRGLYAQYSQMPETPVVLDLPEEDWDQMGPIMEALKERGFLVQEAGTPIYRLSPNAQDLLPKEGIDAPQNS